MSRQTSPSETHRLHLETTTSADGMVLVTLTGEADLHTAPVLSEALDEAIGSGTDTVVVDLTAVTFVDSMMLGVLLGASRRAGPRGVELRIAVEEPHVRRIFELTLLDRVLHLFPTVDAALARNTN